MRNAILVMAGMCVIAWGSAYFSTPPTGWYVGPLGFTGAAAVILTFLWFDGQP